MPIPQPEPFPSWDQLAAAWAQSAMKHIDRTIDRNGGLPLLATHRALVGQALFDGIRKGFSEVARIQQNGVDVSDAILPPPPQPPPADPPSPV